MNKLAHYIATYSVDHKWIDRELLPFCCYAVERRLEFGLFLLIQLLLSILLGKVVEIFTFITVVIAFRHHMGGIHANSVWLCQVVSTASVLVAVIILGPLLEHSSSSLCFTIDATLIITIAIIKPSFPPQVHFSQQDVSGNIQRKKLSLITLIIVQPLSQIWLGNLFIVYSAIGLFFVIISLLLGKIKYCERGDCKP